MAENIDDITMSYEEEGVEVVKELDKNILTRGAWTTIMFRYQQWDPATQKYTPDRYTIRRYRKMGGQFKQQSKFNISNKEQAQKIIDGLKAWI